MTGGEGGGSGRPGDDLLSRVLRRSTIGAEGFHGRVRDGIGCRPLAITTRPSKRAAALSGDLCLDVSWTCCGSAKCRMSSRIRNYFLLAVSSRPPRMILGGLSDETLSCSGLAAAHDDTRIKPLERLVPVSFTHCCASTPGLSTWWSSTALGGELVLREASRLDAFSGYPFRT